MLGRENRQGQGQEVTAREGRGSQETQDIGVVGSGRGVTARVTSGVTNKPVVGGMQPVGH